MGFEISPDGATLLLAVGCSLLTATAIAQRTVGNCTSDGLKGVAEPVFVDTKILLRPQLWVSLNFPSDLTQSEAERLARVVQNLWLVSSSEKGSPGHS